VTEPTPERLQETMEKYGLTDQEARIYLHLSEARKLFVDSTEKDYPEPSLGNIIWRETHTYEHFRALFRELAIRVLSRNYPEGWGYVPPRDEEQR
jgi:hypothetical protein